LSATLCSGGRCSSALIDMAKTAQSTENTIAAFDSRVPFFAFLLFCMINTHVENTSAKIQLRCGSNKSIDVTYHARKTRFTPTVETTSATAGHGNGESFLCDSPRGFFSSEKSTFSTPYQNRKWRKASVSKECRQRRYITATFCHPLSLRLRSRR